MEYQVSLGAELDLGSTDLGFIDLQRSSRKMCEPERFDVAFDGTSILLASSLKRLNLLGDDRTQFVTQFVTLDAVCTLVPE
jgi:hypothetical protein